jgi:hypothetical protein
MIYRAVRTPDYRVASNKAFAEAIKTLKQRSVEPITPQQVTDFTNIIADEMEKLLQREKSSLDAWLKSGSLCVCANPC